jgi:DNA-binding helix-hairpin-helix protein with protein kinase domain
MNGGEGSVYRTYNNMMVKIFKKENITYVNFKKLSEMIEMNLYNPFICWPRDLVYVGDVFVGYVMDEVKGAETLLSLRLQSFSEYTHPERFEICYNFLKHIKYLHDKGILIGDLKPDNILVKSPSEVYFIDCGCYQINDYACPVCHPEYTKRVFKKDELKKQLRTVEDEYYPINKMAFEIMIMKNHTYSPDNMDIENTDKSQFFYPLDVDGIDIKSEDMALWAKFLTDSMRKYFYYYFKQGKITDLSEWVKELQLFLEKIKKEINSNGR